MEFVPRDLKTIGLVIKNARKKKKKKQDWLANILETKASAISSIENGKRPVPRDKVERLAKELGVETSDLIPTRRFMSEIKGLSTAFRGVDTLPPEAIEILERHYVDLKKKFASKQDVVEKTATEVALGLLEECGINKPAVDLTKICQKLRVNILMNQKLTFPGYIFKDSKNVCGIGVQEDMSNGRKRFTIAHELGHLKLNHLSDGKNPKIECNEVGLSKSAREREADDFASALLMPEEWIKEAIGDSIKGIETIFTISNMFDVSRTAAAIRITELSDKRCAVVMSENGNVKWGIASKRLGGWIKRGAKLSKRSQAFKILSHPMMAKKPVATQSSFWFEGELSGKFIEHSAQIFPGSVLSIIWDKNKS